MAVIDLPYLYPDFNAKFLIVLGSYGAWQQNVGRALENSFASICLAPPMAPFIPLVEALMALIWSPNAVIFFWLTSGPCPFFVEMGIILEMRSSILACGIEQGITNHGFYAESLKYHAAQKNVYVHSVLSETISQARALR